MGAELYFQPGQGDDVKQKLRGSVCVYRGEPVYISNTEEHRLQIAYLRDPFEVETIDYRVQEFRYLTPQLGYMNHNRKALYLSRNPVGGWNSPALTRDAIEIVGSTNKRLSDYDDFFRSRALRDCIKGEHPDLNAAKAILEIGEAQSVAFHRHFALKMVKINSFEIEKRGVETVGIIKNTTIFAFDDRNKKQLELATKGLEIDVKTV